jgi:beta-phosphoglucomutase-like phosphatase (HAD superfamily)
LRLPKAVASSTGVAQLESKLRKTAMWELFAPHAYSADLVARAKPAPDIFLHAAAAIGVPPGRCLVLEDSVNGVRAGLAAGMRVWGFVGGGHCGAEWGETLKDAGCETVVDAWGAAEIVFRGWSGGAVAEP